jgi:anti-sigma factor ChrR (cupin superfamily)
MRWKLLMDNTNLPCIVEHLFTIDEHQDEFEWEYFKEGIEISRIYGVSETGASAALLRYAKGAEAPMHMHMGHEHILILSGTQTDGVQIYDKGTLMVSSPGSQHHITSDQGCIVLAIWQAPVSFLSQD